MPTTIKLKNSVTTTSVPSSLVQGEVAINITDKKVWVGNAATTPIQLLGGGADGNFTNISVSSVATFGAGTVSAPSITTSGDTNTGIYFPAADTIGFTEGGVESLRINSSGNLLVGTDTNPSESQARQVLATSSSAYLQFARTATTVGGALIGTGGQNFIVQTYTGAIGSETYTERMRIDSSGRVGIGTNSPAFTLDVRAATSVISAVSTTGTNAAYMFVNNTGGDFYLGRDNSAGSTFGGGAYSANIYSAGAYPMVFWTNAAERMRITADTAIAFTAVTTLGPYIRAGNTNSVANNGTISITSATAGGALVCVYDPGSGLGGVFWVNYSSTVTKIAGDGEATDTGSSFAVYKSANSHTATFKNRNGITASYTIAVYSAFAVN